MSFRCISSGHIFIEYPPNGSETISTWTAFNTYGRLLELQTLVCLIVWLLCADKDEFNFISCGKTTFDIEFTDFLALKKKLFSLAQCCFNLFPRSLGKCHSPPHPPTPRPPTSPSPAVLWPGSHPPAAIAGSSEAAFSQLLKGQISSIVSSLSAFSNHSHGFCALHPNCAFDYWGHFVPSAFPEVTEISCVQSRPRESGGLSPFIHLHWFPLGVRVARAVTFPFLYAIWHFPCTSIPLLLGGKLFVVIVVALKQIQEESRENTEVGPCRWN